MIVGHVEVASGVEGQTQRAIELRVRCSPSVARVSGGPVAGNGGQLARRPQPEDEVLLAVRDVQASGSVEGEHLWDEGSRAPKAGGGRRWANAELYGGDVVEVVDADEAAREPPVTWRVQPAKAITSAAMASPRFLIVTPRTLVGQH